jgi:5-methylcytosine-specific restriction endonuclease McrA
MESIWPTGKTQTQLGSDAAGGRLEALPRLKQTGEISGSDGKKERARQYYRAYQKRNRERLLEYHRTWLKKNQEKMRAYHKEWRAKNPEKVGAAIRRYHERHPAAGLEARRRYYKRNREKLVQKSIKWRRNNPERARRNSRRSTKNHPDRVRERARKWAANNRDKVRAHRHKVKAKRKAVEGSFTGRDVKKLREIQGNRCANLACRESLDKGYHVDHAEPIAGGGTSWVENIQLLCTKCNLKKGKKPFEVWAREQGMLPLPPRALEAQS